MVKHSEDPNPRVSRNQNKILKCIKFKSEPDYYQISTDVKLSKGIMEPNVENVYTMQVYQNCRDRHFGNNNRFGSYKGQLIGCCCDCHDKDNWKHTINKYSPFDEPQILGEVRNRIEYSSMNKNQNRISATVRKLASTKVYPLPKQFQVYSVMPVYCACEDKNKKLPCDCEVCQCNPCPDPNIKTQEDCPCKGNQIVLPCDCIVCKCISCKDPNIKRKTIQDEDLPIIPKPCTCSECICEECVNIRDVKPDNINEETEAKPEDTEAKVRESEVKSEVIEVKSDETETKPEENSEPAEEEVKPEEPEPENNEPAPEDN